MNMRVAAIDLGTARAGIAVSDELGALAHPRGVLNARSREALLRSIRELALTESIEAFLVGIPLDREGREGAEARRARAFAAQVTEVTGCKVVLWDERLTTVEATKRLRDGGHNARARRLKVDAAAACLMLQAWLDGRRGTAE